MTYFINRPYKRLTSIPKGAMADVNDVILSYTFFRSDNYDETQEALNENLAKSGVNTHGSGIVPEGVKTHSKLK